MIFFLFAFIISLSLFRNYLEETQFSPLQKPEDANECSSCSEKGCENACIKNPGGDRAPCKDGEQQDACVFGDKCVINNRCNGGNGGACCEQVIN